YVAYKRAMETARKTGSLPPPKNILNAPTGLMKDLGYGEGYVYEHDAPEGVSNQPLWPIETLQEEFYTPKEIGFERDLLKRKNFYSHRKLSQLKD
ncbi:MAG: replication-associated recombination protein A, partial [Pseudomonadota bacterium]